MAGNSSRRGAIRKGASKKGASVGSGGNRRQKLEGKGPTPKAEDRPGHVAYRKAAAKERRAKREPNNGGKRRAPDDIVAGRNPVVESLVAGVPGSALYVQRNIDVDARIRQSIDLAMAAGIDVRQARREELDDLAGGVNHQGVVMKAAEFTYSDVADLLHSGPASSPNVIVALDGITDPRNLGAIARSAAAFGAGGLIIPSRRSASVTAAAWRTSAGTLARVKVAMVTNMSRTIQQAQAAGFFAVGLAGESKVDISTVDASDSPVLLVVGSEDKGIGRLVGQTCDVTAKITMAPGIESLNAGVAAGVALHALLGQRLVSGEIA